MKNRFVEALKEFHTKFGHPTETGPKNVEEFLKQLELRMRLMEEELREFYNAGIGVAISVREYDADGQRMFMEEMIDGIADLLYVVVGTAVAFGIPLATAFERVHLSNLSKLGADGKPIYREDGKVMKGPNFFPPALKGLVTEELEFMQE